MVKFKEDISQTMLTKKGMKIEKSIKKTRLNKIKLPKGKSVKEAVDELIKDGIVEYAEPNYIIGLESVTPNDTNYALQWGLPAIKANDAWESTTGDANVVIAIVDTGVKTNHVDLMGNIVGGFNAITGTTNPVDDHGHGTHVAGIAAAVVNNSVGVAGVAGERKLCL